MDLDVSNEEAILRNDNAQTVATKRIEAFTRELANAQSVVDAAAAEVSAADAEILPAYHVPVEEISAVLERTKRVRIELAAAVGGGEF